MKGVILAGGRGERLKPYTDFIPKPMVPLLNKPLLEYTLSLFKENEIRDVTMTVCYMKEKIIDYFGDGSAFGMKLSYIEETAPLGTAGSLFRHAEQFQEPIVVVSGDALTNIPIREAFDYHIKKEALVTIVTTDIDSPEDFGICLSDNEGKLVSFLEKPRKNEIFSSQVNTGIYIIDPALFRQYHFSERVDFARDLFPLLLANKERVYVYHSKGYWRDIGNPSQYFGAEADILNGITNIGSKWVSSNLGHSRMSSRYFYRLYLPCPTNSGKMILQKLRMTNRQSPTFSFQNILKIFHQGKGWTTIFFDKLQNNISIYSQSNTAGMAQQYAIHYAGKIKKWQKV